MILVVTYSADARQTLRNVCTAHGGAVARRLGRATLFEETGLGAFLALRLREKHGSDVQIERTRPFNEFVAVPEAIRDAARAYEERSSASTPYAKFQSGTAHPAPRELRGQALDDDGH